MFKQVHSGIIHATTLDEKSFYVVVWKVTTSKWTVQLFLEWCLSRHEQVLSYIVL